MSADSFRRNQPDLLQPPSRPLAIIAYRQPVTRAEIEAIRGVKVSQSLKTLIEKGLIEVKGRKDAIGRPKLYGTTESFMSYFGLESLEDLPELEA